MTPPELPSLPTARPTEARALAAAIEVLAMRRDVHCIVATTVGLAQSSPAATASCWLLDLFQRRLAAEALGAGPPNPDAHHLWITNWRAGQQCMLL